MNIESVSFEFKSKIAYGKPFINSFKDMTRYNRWHGENIFCFVEIQPPRVHVHFAYFKVFPASLSNIKLQCRS